MGVIEGKGAYFKPPEELSESKLLFEEDIVSKWAAWRLQGYEQSSTNGRCPYCSTGDTKKTEIMERIGLWNGLLFADKAYDDTQWKRDLLERHNIRLVTPHRRRRGDPEPTPGRCAADSFVSSIRQKIEIFFNWLNDTTHIQSASKVRSLKGLFLHVFGRLAAAIASSPFQLLIRITTVAEGMSNGPPVKGRP